MGREVRKVPADWQHPTRANGNYIPLMDGSFSKAAAEWDEAAAKWAAGLKPDYSRSGSDWKPKDEDDNESYSEYAGQRPEAEDYMPDWPDEQRTHLQMYEDTSEGTPISPVMETPEGLARWLADNEASAFAGMTATYEQWLATINRGWACSAVMTNGVMDSGVAALAELPATNSDAQLKSPQGDTATAET